MASLLFLGLVSLWALHLRNQVRGAIAWAGAAWLLFGVAMTQSREETPFMGDWSVFDRVRALAAPRVPLVAIDPPPDDVDLRGHRIAITEAGRAVRSGLNDAIRLNGIDEWHGGVHLAGDRESPWRWDATRETLVSLND